MPPYISTSSRYLKYDSFWTSICPKFATVGGKTFGRFALPRSIRPKFRPLHGRVRRVPRPSLSRMFEQMSPIFIKLHCHYSVLPGFVAGTSDIRTTFFSLHKWRKKLQVLISELPGMKPGKTE